MSAPIRLRWHGPDDATLMGQLNRACRHALSQCAGLVLTEEAPQLLIVTDGSTPPAAGALVVHYPLVEGLMLPPGRYWAASGCQQVVLPAGAPLLRPGGHLGDVLPEPDEARVLMLGAASPPAWWQGELPVLLPGMAGIPALAADPQSRRALWALASAVVFIDGDLSWLPLAIEARAAGLSVWVPAGRALTELAGFQDVFSYETETGKVNGLPLPETLAKVLPVGRVPYVGDLAAWRWSRWAAALALEARRLVDPESMRLTVAVVADGDPAALDRALRSVAAVADELLVAASPALAAVAAAYGARLLPWERGDVAGTRNRLMAQARGSWLLMMNGDEELVAGADELAQLKLVSPQGPDICLAHRVVRRSEGGSRKLAYLAPRLYARHADLHWQEGDLLINRQLGPADTGATIGSSVTLAGPTLSESGAQLRHGQALRLLRQGLRQDPRNPQLHFQMGLLLSDRGDLRSGIRHLRRCLDLLKRLGLDTGYLGEGMTHWLACEVQLGHFAEAERLAGLFEADCAGRAGFWVNRGLAIAMQGRWAEACEAWERGWALPDDEGHRQRLASLLALAAYQRADAAGAAAWLMHALSVAALPEAELLAWAGWLLQQNQPSLAEALLATADGVKNLLAEAAPLLQQLVAGQRVDPGWLAGLPEPRGLGRPVPAERLAVCLIVKDEARYLERCLSSIQAVADELFVLDTGSTDDSPAIAAAYGAQVNETVWTGHFAEARNHSIAPVNAEWIMAIDGDEELDVGSVKVLNDFLYAAPPGPVIYDHTFQPVDADGTLMKTTYQASRMFRRHPALRFVGRIHEQIASVDPQVVPEHRLMDDVRVWHYGYSDEVIARRGKLERNRALLDQAVQEAPQDAAMHYALGSTLDNLGRTAEAEAAWQRCVEICLADGGLPPYLRRALLHLLKAALIRGDGERCAALVAVGAQHCPDFAEFWQHAGMAQLALQRPQAARSAFERALAMPDLEHGVPIHYPDWRWRAHVGLAEALLQLNDPEGAVSQARAASQLAPGVPEVAAFVQRVLALRPSVSPGRISLCVIAGDDPEGLLQTLASAGTLAAEAIVIDTGREGRAGALVAGQARVVRLPWQDDFAQARNSALAQATGDWVLMLDCDERLDEAAVPLLRELCTATGPAAEVCLLPIIDGDDGSVVWAARLFRRDADLHFVGAVDERLTHRVLGDEGLLVRSLPEARIWHFPGNDARRAEKRAQRLQLLAARHAAQPDDAWLTYALAAARIEHGQADEAWSLLLGLIARGPQAGRVLAPAYDLAICLLWDDDRLDEGRQLAQAAIEACPRSAGLWLHFGLLNLHLGEPAKAAGALRRAIYERSRGGLGLQARPELAWQPEANLGRLLLGMGHAAEAEAFLRRALAAAPQESGLRAWLRDALLAQGRDEEALQPEGLEPASPPAAESPAFAKALTCLAEARRALEQGRERAASRHFYNAFALMAEAGGWPPDAAEVLNQWRHLEAGLGHGGWAERQLAAWASPGSPTGPVPAGAERARLSVCMIVRNEADHLARCLASIDTVADEIVVVDTGSTDASPSIAAAFGAKVLTVSWADHFAAARNHALAAATGDWVLSIDADEQLDPMAAPILAQFLMQWPVGFQVFGLAISSLDDDGLPAEDIRFGPRLFARLPDVRYAGRIHEHLTHPALPMAYELLPALTLWHHGYTGAAMAAGDKLARNLRLLDLAIAEEPDDPFHHYHRAVTLGCLGRRQEALSAYARCVALGQTQALIPHCVIEATDTLLQNAIAAGDLAGAAHWVESGRGVCRRYAPFWVHAGVLALRTGRYQQAVTCFETTLALDEDAVAANGVATLTTHWRAHTGLVEAYRSLGDTQRALRHLWRALALAPDQPDVRQSAQRLFAELPPTQPGRLSVCLIVRDEAEMLPACLASLSGCVDEIVVLDTGSSDATVQVAGAAGARVITWPWTGDFAAARNEALRHATGEWVLMIDADERLEVASMERLKGLCPQQDLAVDLYLLPVRDAWSGETAWQGRLLRRRPHLGFAGPVFERVVDRRDETAELVSQAVADVVISHVGYGAETGMTKLQRLAGWVEGHGAAGRLAGTTDQWARLRLQLGDVAGAEGLWQEMIGRTDAPLRARTAAYGAWIDALLARGDGRALALAEKAIGDCPGDAGLWLLFGLAHAQAANRDQAIGALRHSLWLRGRHPGSVLPRPDLAWRPEALLGKLLVEAGDLAAAVGPLRAACAARPDLWEIHRLLISAHLRLDQFEPAAAALRGFLAAQESAAAFWAEIEAIAVEAGWRPDEVVMLTRACR